MLLAWFRGAFLVGILGWYSISVWKLIDGYFKDQFENYLKEEYRKNPRMKTDVEGEAARNSVNKKESVLTEILTTPRSDDSPLARMVQQVEEKRSIDVVGNYTMKIEGSDEKNRQFNWRNDKKEKKNEEKTSERLSLKDASFDCTKCSWKNGIFLLKEAEIKCEAKEERNIKGVLGTLTLNKEGETRNEKVSLSIMTTTTTTTTAATTGHSLTKKKKKTKEQQQRGKTTTLKASDFTAARGGRGGGGETGGGSRRTRRIKVKADKDFWEFEEEEEEVEKDEGISVEELPFKPRVDIGRLERVTSDEYCPLTLEDELSCGETSKWP